ncbi:hypothetical protein VKT23_005470 [Stygiomarasmius scandens]|uniref:N-acetyltransferase domain-containing protein n=1 Tax=Marasmiellus scandens TaxID=2682957 RepID=A0ABR1JW30_9AGAR
MSASDQQRTIRPANTSDAEACAAIYASYVLETAISFESIPPSTLEMAERITTAISRYAWIVLEEAGVIRGYAYAAPYASRQAYDWSCEVSVYLDRGYSRRSGAGRALYEELFKRLEERGFRMLIASITVPNEASLGLHCAMGFEAVGTFKRIGFKNEQWWDVARLQKPLGNEGEPPRPLK